MYFVYLNGTDSGNQVRKHYNVLNHLIL